MNSNLTAVVQLFVEQTSVDSRQDNRPSVFRRFRGETNSEPTRWSLPIRARPFRSLPVALFQRETR